MRELTVTDWVLIWLLALTAVLIVHVNSHAETVLTSTESLKETDQEIWIPGKHEEESSSPFYELEMTTETVTVRRKYDGYFGTMWYTKFRKVYYEVEGTECVGWEKEWWRSEYNSIDKRYTVHKGRCIRELVYMADGRVLWRKVKP